MVAQLDARHAGQGRRHHARRLRGEHHPEQLPAASGEDHRPAKLLPPQTQPTIGDRLSEKGVGWAWYSGGWNDALAGKPAASFQFHHQPFAYFQQFADGTDPRRRST